MSSRERGKTTLTPAPPPPGGGNTKTGQIELLGPARLLAGVKVLTVEIGEELTVARLIPRLAACCPVLVGPVLDLERGALVDGYVFNRNGRDFLHGAEAAIRPGDRLLLLASSAGG